MRFSVDCNLQENRDAEGRKAIGRTAGAYLSVRASTPGSFFAFEEFEAGAAAGGDVGDLVGYAGLVDGRDGVAAADDGNGCLVGGHGLGDGVGADGEAGELEDAGGAVPHDGAGGGDDLLNGGDGLGTDVEALPVGGEVDGGVPGLGFGVGGEAVGEHVIDGEQDLHALGFALGEGFLGDVDLVFFYERLAGGDAEGTLEGVRHSADDDQGIYLVQQVIDDVDLAGDFGAADDGDEGLFGSFESLAEVGNFLFHQQAGHGGLEEVGDAFGGGMGAMGGAERVVDVDLGQRGEGLGEGGIVGFFFGVIA